MSHKVCHLRQRPAFCRAKDSVFHDAALPGSASCSAAASSFTRRRKVWWDTPSSRAASREETPPPPPSQAEQFSNLPGFVGKMARRWGWLAGVYIAFQGAGVALVGAIARWTFGSMFSTSNQMMESIGGFGTGGGWTYNGPPEMEGAVMEALGVAPQTSPLSGVQGVFLGVANLIIVLGVLWLAAGLILSFVLWKKGKKGD